MREERLQKAIELGLVPDSTTLAPDPESHRAWNDLNAGEKAYWARVMQVNAGMMEAADFHIGRLLEHIDGKGELDNTLVIVTSDNGAEFNVIGPKPGPLGWAERLWMLSEGWDTTLENLGLPGSMGAIGAEWASVSSAPFRHYKFSSGDGGLRVPLVISGPGIENSGIREGRAHVADLAPTILDAAGVAYAPGELYGRSLWPILAGKAEVVYGEGDAFGFEVSGNAAMFRGDWKIARVTPPLGDGEWRLYDLSADPGESTDLAAANPDLLEDMLNEYRSYSESVGVFEPGPEYSATNQILSNSMRNFLLLNWYIILAAVLILAVLIVYFGLPRLLTALGLHPHYRIPAFSLPGKRALIVTTSHGVLGDSGKATGVFGSEMSVPYYAFLDAGMEVDIASVKGGKIPVEPRSMGWPLATGADYRFRKDSAASSKMSNSIPIDRVDPSKYDVVFLSGGWGAAYDFAQSSDLAELVTAANANGAILGTVCHGALGLVNARAPDGSSLIEGRAVTGVTDKQIQQLGIEITPKHPETELRAMNSKFEAKSAFRDMFATHVVVDGNLVTGQNQNSGAETSHRILELLA